MLILLRILFQSQPTAKLLQFSDTVSPSSDVNGTVDVGVNAFGHHQEKNAPFREEDFAFINSLKNMTQKNQRFRQEPNSVQEIKEKITSDLSQWSDELKGENVITLKDFDKWRKNGIDEALQNHCNLPLNQGTHRKKNYFSSKSCCDVVVEARSNWARRPMQFHLTVRL